MSKMSGCVVAVCFNNILHPTIFSWYFLKHVCRFISEICWKIVKIRSDKVFVFSYAVHFSLLNTFVYIVDPDIRVHCIFFGCIFFVQRYECVSVCFLFLNFQWCLFVCRAGIKRNIDFICAHFRALRLSYSAYFVLFFFCWVLALIV